MKIGISTDYQNLVMIPKAYSDYQIEHVQLGVPANVDTIRNELVNMVSEFRSASPTMEISIHAYPYNLAEKVSAVRDAWTALAESTISIASEIGAAFVNFHLGYGYDAAKRTQHEDLIEELIPVLNRIVEKGCKNHVDIHIENLYPEQRNSDFSKLGDRTSDFSRIFESIAAPQLKLCYDYGHGNLDEHGIEILRTFASRLGSIHAHDNDQLADIHWPIGGGERNTIDWANELQYLQQINFTGVFILESYYEDQLESLMFLQNRI
jgi:sugar phosphate isomerase/epimerase